MVPVNREIRYYTTPLGRTPFRDWIADVKDFRTKNRILIRIVRLQTGNPGDFKSVGGGVFELRVHMGSGYRVYFGFIDQTVILILCGGDKDSQQKDVGMAKSYWADFRRRRHENKDI